ncbi:MAG: nuclear transport factor 2 family protein [Gemmatimonadota bacterium]
MKKGFLAVACLIGGTAACERELAPEIAAVTQLPDSAEVAAELEAIHALSDRYEVAFASGEPVRLLYHYTDGAVEIRYNGHVWSAEEGVTALLSELEPGATVSIESQYTVLSSSADVAYDVGRYRLHAATTEDSLNETYRYVVGLKKVDREWRIDLMMISAPMSDEETPAEGSS